MSPFRRSVVWKYFVKKNSEIVMCIVCKKELRFNSSTTNMIAHLKCKKHPFLKKDGDEDHEYGNRASTSFSAGPSDSIEYPMKISGEVLNYQKLVVPVKMRSVYWKCYGFPASEDGQILTKVKTVCLICKNVISYNGNTSNLKTHLQKKHSEELAQLESMLPEKAKSELARKRNEKKDKEVGNMYSTSISGSVILSNESVNSITKDEFESYVQNSENNQIDSSDLNVYSNKVKVDKNSASHKSAEEGGVQTCTIESLHPFIIPLETKSVSDTVIEFIIMDMQLPDIVEGRGFQNFIATLKSPCEIPSKCKLIEEVIPRVYDSFKESLLEALQNIKTNMSLSVEEWESRNGDIYVTFSVSYHPEKDENLVNKVLSTVHCYSSANSFFWDMIFDNLLEEWNLNIENIKVVVCATTQQELLKTFTQKGLIIVPCLIHTIQEICTSVCLDQDRVCEVLQKCRAIIYVIYKSNSALASLRIQDHLMTLEETSLVSDHQKMWLSTYYMLEAILARRQILRTILDNAGSSSHDNDAITLTEDDWTLIEDIVAVLEPFKVTVMTLSEERTPLVSLIKPLLWQLLSVHLKSKDEDSENVQIFKNSLKSLLSERYYSNTELDELLNIATTMDPRFKSLPNMTKEAKESLDGPIKDSLAKLIEESPRDVKQVVEDIPEKKKPRLLGMVMMLGDMCPAMPPATSMSLEDRTNLELVQYQSEETAPLDQCPIAWWGRTATKCPNLARLATQYTCIPAAAIPSSRIALETQLAYETRRANLMPEIIDRLIFLNANNSL